MLIEVLFFLAFALAVAALLIAVRRQRNAAVAARAQLLATLDALPVLVSYVDTQQRYQFVNRAYEGWFNVPRERLVGRTLSDVVGADAYARVKHHIERALAGEAVEFRGEVPYPGSIGTRVVNVSYVPDRSPDGKVRGYFALVHDVTGEARTLESVRAAEAAATSRFQVLADHAPVLIWMTDSAKNCTWFNRPWMAFTGRTLEEELAGGWMQGVHPDDLQRCTTTYDAAFEGRLPFTIEFRLRRHDGEYRWALATGGPVYDEQTAFAGYIGSCIDITERRTVEQQHAALLQQAENANRLKDEFLATLSHELRTPLNTVMGWVHLLRDGSRSEAEVSNALDVIERNLRVQSKLVDDVLDVSRIVSGKLRLELQNVDIANIVQAAVNVLQPTAEAKGVEITMNIREGHGFVAGDPARLHQAIWNVVANGVKFTRKGGSVDVQVRRTGGYVDVTVADTGIGIPEEFVAHVFERFRQAEAGYAREFGGLGLGLAIVRHLVELHGGSVSVHSPGRELGTTFTLRFPLLAAHPAADTVTPARQESAQIVGLRVLVVDDDADALGLMSKILESGGAIVATAESAADALAQMDHSTFDVLLSDLAMPGEDGCDLMRQIRQRPAGRGRDIPAAAVTAYARPEDRARVLRAGFQLHLAKPVNPEELLAVVQALAARNTADDILRGR